MLYLLKGNLVLSDIVEFLFKRTQRSRKDRENKTCPVARQSSCVLWDVKGDALQMLLGVHGNIRYIYCYPPKPMRVSPPGHC